MQSQGEIYITKFERQINQPWTSMGAHVLLPIIVSPYRGRYHSTALPLLSTSAVVPGECGRPSLPCIHAIHLAVIQKAAEDVLDVSAQHIGGKFAAWMA